MLEILPHDSAETSNTDSNLTDGVLYGFFAPACSGAFSFEVLSVVQLSLPRFNFETAAFAEGALVVFRPQWHRQRTILIQI